VSTALETLFSKVDKPQRRLASAKKREISGIADYVMYAPGIRKRADLESTLIVVEAKKGTTFAKGRAQVAAYLAGIQQQRLSVNDYDQCQNSHGQGPRIVTRP
jgi:hypothetical protein